MNKQKRDGIYEGSGDDLYAHDAADSQKGVAYYRPPRGTRGGPWVPCEIADRDVWGAFVRAATEPEFLEHVLLEIRAQQRQQSPTGERDRLRARLAKLERRVGRLTDMRADGELSRVEYADRSTAARTQVESVKRQLEALEQRMSLSSSDVVRKMFMAARLLVGSQEKLSADEKRQVLSKATDGIAIRARRDPQKQGKDAKGRYKAVSRRPWRVESVTFDFRAPPGGVGCLDTTESCWARRGRARR